MEEAKKSVKEKQTVMIIILLLLLMAAIGVTLWALFFREPDTPLPPDYPPAVTEDAQQPIKGDDTGKFESSGGGGAVNLTYTPSVTVDLSEKTATLYFANPSKSNQDMVVRLVVDDVVIFQTDRITPGNMVKTLEIEDGVESKLQVGGYDAEYTVYYFNSETGEKAIVETQAPGITVTVVE